MINLNTIIISAIVIQWIFSLISKLAGAILGFFITTGFLVWGINSYSTGGFIEVANHPITQPVFFLACLVYYGFNILEIIKALKNKKSITEEQKSDQPTKKRGFFFRLFKFLMYLVVFGIIILGILAFIGYQQENTQTSNNENQFANYHLSQQALNRLISLYPKYQPLIPQEQLKFANYFTNLFKDINEPNLSARKQTENSILVQKSSQLFVGTRIKKWICVIKRAEGGSIVCPTLNVVSSKIFGVDPIKSYPIILDIDDNAHTENYSLVGDHEGVFFEGDIVSVSGDITNVIVNSEMGIRVQNVQLEGLEQNR
jgi:hypothetical protein